MGSFSLIHWLIVGIVVLVIFGPGRVGNAGKELGRGIREFKDALKGDGTNDDDKKA
jgi:sec-independent protein translocase protein TatA